MATTAVNTVLLYLVAKSQLTLSKTDLERLQELLPGRTAEGIRCESAREACKLLLLTLHGPCSDVEEQAQAAVRRPAGRRCCRRREEASKSCEEGLQGGSEAERGEEGQG